MAHIVRFALLLPLLLTQPTLALGHGNGLPWIWLESEQVMPGDPLNVIVIDFEPHGQVDLELVADETRAPLGTVPLEGDGHGEAEFVMPEDFPIGYAELTATDAAGNDAVTLLYVGEAPAGMGPPAPPERPTFPAGASPAALEWWMDPSVLMLGAILFGTAGAFMVMLLRRPRQRQETPQR